jgi:hypothetical protein
MNIHNFINDDDTNTDVDTDTDTDLDTDSDSDSDSDTNEILYEPEEASLKKYSLVLCELYNDSIHGKITFDLNTTTSASINMNKQHLVLCRFKSFNLICISGFASNRMQYYTDLLNNSTNIKHNIYKNYKAIISNENYIKPELAECIYLPSGHCVCIIKTFWLKLIQRRWKNICKQRTHIINCRSNPYTLFKKEITGKWPDNCRYLPGLKGMLQELCK